MKKILSTLVFSLVLLAGCGKKCNECPCPEETVTYEECKECRESGPLPKEIGWTQADYQ